MVYGYVSGGIASEATGGDFLMGAATGAIVSLANHWLHGTKYKRVEKVLKKLHNFVKSNPTILSNLAYYSGFSEQKVLELLKFGKGPETYIKELTNAYGETSGDGKIYLDEKLVRGLELAKLPITIKGTSFTIAVTALHEFVHWGRIKNNLDFIPSYEYGRGFEIYSFGVDINNNNAIEYAKKFNWNY